MCREETRRRVRVEWYRSIIEYCVKYTVALVNKIPFVIAGLETILLK